MILSMWKRHERPVRFTVNAFLKAEWWLFKRKHVFLTPNFNMCVCVCVCVRKGVGGGVVIWIWTKCILVAKYHKRPLLRNGPFWSLGLIKTRGRNCGCNKVKFPGNLFHIFFGSKVFIECALNAIILDSLSISWPCFFRINASLSRVIISRNISDLHRYFRSTSVLFAPVCEILQNFLHSALF